MPYVLIENWHHQAFFYKIVKIKVKCFYLRNLSNITTYIYNSNKKEG